MHARKWQFRILKKNSDVSKRPRASEKLPAPTPKATLKLSARVLGQCGGDHHRAYHRAARGFRQEISKREKPYGMNV